MWQRKESRQEVPGVFDDFCQASVLIVVEIAILGVLANKQGKLYIRQILHNLAMPERSAFMSGRQVATTAFAGIAKTHRHNGNFAGIVKYGFVNIHPSPKIITTFIIPGGGSLMRGQTRSLTDNKNFTFRSNGDDRTRIQRQTPATYLASSYLSRQIL